MGGAELRAELGEVGGRVADLLLLGEWVALHGHLQEEQRVLPVTLTDEPAGQNGRAAGEVRITLLAEATDEGLVGGEIDRLGALNYETQKYNF